VRFVDANVFIYALIKSPREDYLIARGILKRIEEGEEAITSTAVVQEVVDWLEYNNRKAEVEKFLIALNSYVSMKKVAITWADALEAIPYMKKYGLDFVDSLTLQVMKRNGVKEIYTNDRDFDRVEWIHRVWR
jgi:predicted nucleic acid-binding protein